MSDSGRTKSLWLVDHVYVTRWDADKASSPASEENEMFHTVPFVLARPPQRTGAFWPVATRSHKLSMGRRVGKIRINRLSIRLRLEEKTSSFMIHYRVSPATPPIVPMANATPRLENVHLCRWNLFLARSSFPWQLPETLYVLPIHFAKRLPILLCSIWKCNHPVGKVTMRSAVPARAPDGFCLLTHFFLALNTTRSINKRLNKTTKQNETKKRIKKTRLM